jgi:hypothetical protein
MTIVLPVVALVLAGSIFALKLYLGFRSPAAPGSGVRSLQRGLQIGAVSSAALLLVYVVLYVRPIAFGRNLPFVVIAFVGNIANLVAVVDCVRELTGESLFATVLLLLDQLLWIFYGFGALMAAN